MKNDKKDRRGGWEVYACLLCALLLHPASQAMGALFFAMTQKISGHQFIFFGDGAFYSADLGRLIGSILVFSFCIGFGIDALRRRKVLIPVASMMGSSLFFAGRVLPMLMTGSY